MRVDFAFGKTGLITELPEGFRYRLLETQTAKPLADPAAAIGKSLDAPSGSSPLEDLARGKSSAAISVCDITRPAPNRQTLPPVLARLERAGIPRDGITILIATGLHRPATSAEIREICGEDIAAKYRVVNHNARELREHRNLGLTSSGTPVHVDERFVSSELRITLGFIEPHLMLGYSGGRKLVAPGLAAQETIRVLHSPKFMRDTRSVEGEIQDNPLHRELLEIARMAGHDFILDVALGRGPSGEGSNSGKPICGIFAGDPVAAHRQGVKFVSDVMLQEIAEPVDAVITTAAGYPLDLTFYQAIKGVTAAAHIVKRGGKILLLAACQEGSGAPEFTSMLRQHPSDSEFLQHISGTTVTIDQWQLEKLALVTAKAEVLFYVPGLPREYHSTLWGRAFSSAPEAIQALTSSLGRNASIAVIPEGPYVLAKVAGASARNLPAEEPAPSLLA